MKRNRTQDPELANHQQVHIASFSWVTPPLFHQNRCNHFGAAVREDAPKAPLATAKEGELAAEALGVADATHGAHDEPEDSIPECGLLELSASATARVEAPRHQVRSEKPRRAAAPTTRPLTSTT